MGSDLLDLLWVEDLDEDSGCSADIFGECREGDGRVRPKFGGSGRPAAAA